MSQIALCALHMCCCGNRGCNVKALKMYDSLTKTYAGSKQDTLDKNFTSCNAIHPLFVEWLCVVSHTTESAQQISFDLFLLLIFATFAAASLVHCARIELGLGRTAIPRCPIRDIKRLRTQKTTKNIMKSSFRRSETK